MNRSTMTYKKLSKEKHIEEASLVKIPSRCKSCIYYPPEYRICFYGYIPPCRFKKDKDVCKRWFKPNIEINS